MNANCLKVVLLHEHPEYFDSCAELLSRQWKMSRGARFHQLKPSCEDLPNSIILLEEIDGERKIVGHSRVRRVLGDKNGVWICSVVIAEEKRKKGYGKYLMEKTEEYAKILKYSTAYLNTHDQQGFYEHLGYTYCSPVSSANFKVDSFMEKNWNKPVPVSANLPKKFENNKDSQRISGGPQTDAVPPPPPPPLPLSTSKNQNMTNTNLVKYWMKKKL